MNQTRSETKRAEKAQYLPVIQVDEGKFYVQSEEGKIAYLVSTNGAVTCSCADFSRNGRTDPEFACKHILAVLNTDSKDMRLAGFLEKRKPKLDERFIINLKDKDFVLYAGLLDLAHQKGICQMEVNLIQYPSKENGMEAICKATVTTRTGEVFTDIGDANPSNTNRAIAPHLIRMASTRAKARVLRDVGNIGMTALEELGDLENIATGDAAPKDQVRTPSRRKGKVTSLDTQRKHETPQESKGQDAQQPQEQPQTPPQSISKEASRQESRPPMSEAQKRAIANLSRRRGISESETERMSQEMFGLPLPQLSSSDAASFIRQLQQSA